MLAIDKFLKSDIQKNDIIFVTSTGIGADILYIPESGNISNFFKTQKLNNLSRVENIIIPPRMVVGGKTIINNTYYISIKKQLKGFSFFKVPPKLKMKNRMRLMDISPMISDIVNVSNQKTITAIYNEAFQKCFSSFQDFKKSQGPEERPNVLLIDLDLNHTRTGFTKNLEYYLKLNSYNLEIKNTPLPDSIIYRIGLTYYPIAKKITEETSKGTRSYLKISRVMFQRVLNIYDELLMDPNYDITKDKKEEPKVKILGFKNEKNLEDILRVGNDIEDIYSKIKTDNPIELAKNASDYIEGNPIFHDLNGSNFREKLQNLDYAVKHAEKLLAKQIPTLKKDADVLSTLDTKEEEDLITGLDTNTGIQKQITVLSEAQKELLKKYNGTVFLKDMENQNQNRSYNPDNIVGLSEFNGYDKQAQEFYNNLDASIEDLIQALAKDQDIGIKIHKIDSTIKDDNKTRYKEFSAQISHSYGQTYGKKYSVKFKVPYPVEGKYLKIGGNDYVMVNQLFNKPIQKVNSHLARLYTHYNTTSVTLKNSKLNGKTGLSDIEKETIVGLKKLGAGSSTGGSKFKIKTVTETMTTETKDTMEFLEPRIRNLMEFQKIKISSPKFKFSIDLTGIDPDSSEQHEFYRYQNTKIITEASVQDTGDQSDQSGQTDLSSYETAKFNFKTKEIVYKQGDDIRLFPIEHLDEFLLGLYNKVSIKLLGTDIIKKSKSSVPYFSARIIGKNIPVAVLMVTELGFSKAMERMSLKWLVGTKKSLIQDDDSGSLGAASLGGAPLNIPCYNQGKRAYISIYPKTLKQRHLALGLLKYKIPDVEFMETSNDLYFKAISKDMGEVGFYKLKESVTKIIDPTTEKILREYGYPTDVLELYSNTIPNMLLDRGSSHFENLDYYRIRMSEAISHIGYNQIQRAISELKKKKNFPDRKLELQPDFIMSQLLAAGIFQNAKTINPIEEAMLSQKIVKTGIGNVTKSQVTLARRDLNRSYFGVISPTATNEYGGIGANQTLTNGTTIKDRFGSIKTKEYNNEDNPFNMLSPVESLTPFFEYDDTTRRIMGNQQTGQFTQLQNPDEPLVQTGFESYFPWLVSDRFAKKARIQGKVSIKNGILTINGTGPDIGKEQKVPLRSSKSRTKRGIYLLNKYNLQVSDGQNVKKNGILAATSSLSSGKLSIGKNLVVAEMGYNGLNYEDGWVITGDVQDKYKSTYLQKTTIMVPEDVKITYADINLNQMTKTGDKLFSFIKKDYYVKGLEEDQPDLDPESEDTLYGLEQHGSNSTYYSPGGKINEIVVKLNSNKVDQKLKNLWTASVKDLGHLQKECRILSEKNPEASKKEKEEIYMNCMGNTDNISTLQIGGHKINGEEPGWAIIEIYIERDNPINNGSKFTLGNSGGKGTVQYIIPKGSEPVTAETKLKVEFIPTSLSIVKRKNPSIYFMMYLGKCFYFVNEMVRDLARKDYQKIKKFVLEVYKFVDKTPDNQILNEIKDFFKQPEAQIKKAINQSDSLNRPLFPAIKQPFKNAITMRDIKQLANYIGIPLKEKILVPENDGSYTMKKVPVGILNIYLLEHFPQSQGSVRGSQYVKNSIITNQGSSGTKDRKGATKTGLYDLYSLLTKTPYSLIKELHSLKSDAKGAKYQYQKQLLLNNTIPSIKDIKITKDDTPTKNYVESLLLGAGLKAFY